MRHAEAGRHDSAQSVQTKMAAVMRETAGQVIVGQYIKDAGCQEGFELDKLVINREGLRNLHEGRGHAQALVKSVKILPRPSLFLLPPSLSWVGWPSPCPSVPMETP